MQASPFAQARLGPFEEAAPHPAGPLDAWRQGSGSSRDARSIHRRSLDDAGLLHMATSAGAGAPLPTAASLGSMGRSASVSNPFDVTELLARISLLSATPTPPPALASAGSGGGPRCLSTDGVNRMQWVQPSGPRRMGEGVEDVEQGVVLAQPSPTGGALLRVTLLAAGFLVGPSGSSVREICRATGADIKSWTADPDEQCTRSCRVFRVEGSRQGVARAVGIMCDAVARYKELCEGAYAGKSVSRIQHVGGVDFSYQPPPRSIVPFAAALKGQSSARRQGSGRQGSTGAPSAKPPAAPRKGSMGRSGSLGAPPASSVPVPSATLSRSASVPQPDPAGSAAVPQAASPPTGDRHGSGGHHRRSSDFGASASASRMGSAQGDHKGDGPGGTQPMARSSSDAVGVHRSSSVEAPCGQGQHISQPMAPARASKLEKDDVMRSLFGAPDGPSAPAAPQPAPVVDVTALLQQLMVQEAQQQASASNLLGQQGVRGGYELTEPGILLPASLSPLAPAPQPLPPFSAGLASVEAQLAAQGLTGSTSMLAAVAAAWQSSPARPAVNSVDELLQLAAAGLLGPLGSHAGGAGPGRQPSVGHPPLAAERSVPLAPYPSMDGAVDAAMAMAAAPRPAVPTSRGNSPPGQEQHLPLSAFQTTSFTPFASVGSPPSDAGLASPHSGRSSESSSRGGPGTVVEQQEPATPRQRRPAAGAVVTPGSGQAAGLLHHEHATPDVGTYAGRVPGASSLGGHTLASLVAAPQPMAPGADITGTLASAFALLPGGGELAGEPQGPAGEEGDRLSPFSAAPFLPLSGAALARAASTPGPQGSCSSIDRLHGMLALARANSYAAPSEPDAVDAVAPPAHPDELGALEPQFAIPAPSHGSLFASAFSPRPRGLRQAPSLPTPPLAPPRPAARLGSRSASIGGALGGSANIYNEVDRMVDTMF